MDQLYPLVRPLPQRDDDRSAEPEPAADAAPAPEPYVDLPRHIWTKPLTQKQWEEACAMIMWFAQHGGC